MAELAVATQGEVWLGTARVDSTGLEFILHQGQGVGVQRGGQEVPDYASAEALGTAVLGVGTDPGPPLVLAQVPIRAHHEATRTRWWGPSGGNHGGTLVGPAKGQGGKRDHRG